MPDLMSWMAWASVPAVLSSTRQPVCCTNGVTQSSCGSTLPVCTGPAGTTSRSRPLSGTADAAPDTAPAGEALAAGEGPLPEQPASRIRAPARAGNTAASRRPAGRSGRGSARRPARLAGRPRRAFSACPLTER